MRNYEIMFIIRPTLEEKDVKSLEKEFEGIIKDNGGKLVSVEDMGQKELAYEIAKCKSGYYYLFEVEAKDDKAINEFKRLATNNTNMIRHLITRIEK